MTILVWGIGQHTSDILARLQEAYGIVRVLRYGDILLFQPTGAGQLPALMALLVDMIESQYIHSFTVQQGRYV